MAWRRIILGACASVLALAIADTAAAQSSGSSLPAEVSAWMERDQAQRWRAMVAEGDSIFNNASCSRCHGDAGTGGNNGPDLTDDAWGQGDGSLESIQRTIFWGVRRELFSTPDWRFEMNPAGGLRLEWSQYASLAAYVWTLSNGSP